MLNETLILFAAAMLLLAAAASLALWGYLSGIGRRWAWLCLIAACIVWGLRSAIPFWVAINVGLYDFRDALLAALSAALCLAAVAGLLRPRA